jgi:hypothetical protein
MVCVKVILVKCKLKSLDLKMALKVFTLEIKDLTG